MKFLILFEKHRIAILIGAMLIVITSLSISEKNIKEGIYQIGSKIKNNMLQKMQKYCQIMENK